MEFTTVLKLYWKETLILTIALAALIPIVGVIIVLASWKYSSRKQKLQVEKKHCLILGGSQGLGKSIALELVKQGAHVTIVARNTTNLKEAVTDLLVHKHNDQLIQYYSVDLMDYDKCVDLFAELRNKNQLPNWLICTNGSANPGFINDQTIQDFTFMMDSNCTSTVNAVKALLQITKQPKNNNVKSSSKKNEISSLIKSDGFIAGISRQQRQLLPDRIVFTGSVLSLLSMIGYSAYSTSRYALRGFADALRSELAPLGIQVHFMMPGYFY